jgi:hypothetical protein
MDDANVLMFSQSWEKQCVFVFFGRIRGIWEASPPVCTYNTRNLREFAVCFRSSSIYVNLREFAVKNPCFSDLC